MAALTVLCAGAVAQDSAHPLLSGDDTKTDPLLTVMWTTGGAPRLSAADVKSASELGANIIWTSSGNSASEFEETVAQFRRANEQAGTDLKIQLGSSPIHNADAQKVRPDWRPRRYLASRPVKATGGSVEIDLLAGYARDFDGTDKGYSVDTETLEPSNYWIAWDLTVGERLSPERWDVQTAGGFDPDARVIIHDAKQDHSYSVTFVVTDSHGNQGNWSNTWVDFMVPEAREHIWDQYENWLDIEVDIFRPTHLIYFYHQVHSDGSSRILDWYGYNVGIHPDNIEAMEEATGKPFDPSFLVDEGVIKTANDVPAEDYFPWMEVVQQSNLGFAQEYNQRIHASGKDRRTRMFIDDAWVGIEPHRGMLDQAGFDEAATPMNWAADVRRFMDFEGNVKRVVRLGMWMSAPQAKQRIVTAWSRGLRGILFDVPDGITFGGDIGSLAHDYEESPEIRERLCGIFNDFENYHRLLHGRDIYTHPLNLYVVNAWGDLRSWPKYWTVYFSQHILEALTDLPIDVHFYALRDIENNGVPEDADILLNVGEPESSWSGGFYWTDTVADHVRSFVEQGGGFIGIDGPTIHDGQLMVDDVLGLNYEGPASEEAKKRQYPAQGSNEAWRRNQSPADHATSVLKVDGEGPLFKDLPADFGRVFRLNSLMEPEDNTRVLSEDGALVTMNEYGAGKAAYINGIIHDGQGMEVFAFEEFLKRMIYEVAGKEEWLEELDVPTPGAYVYYYPERQLVVVYNRAHLDEVRQDKEGVSEDVVLRAGVLDEIGEQLVFEPVLGTEERREPTVSELRQGITLNVPKGQVCIWKVVGG
ncbi:MAG: 1,3-beta-galactosyl-N-acetylhexosamine phosphorylase N-terminal domain-containing protein [Candidatus Hydrogenedentota bacterium]